MILIDTSFIIALINERDSYHQIAAELSQRFDRQPALTTDAILLEIGDALSRPPWRASARDVISDLIDAPEIEIVSTDRQLFHEALEFFAKHDDKTYGLTDCISFVAMRERGITQALTCDKHFVQAGSQALMLDLLN